MLKRGTFVLAILFVTAAVFASSSVVEDPLGDSTAPYVDIVQTKVTERTGTDLLFLMMELAEAIPARPAEAFLSWEWTLDTDPTTAPGGGPFEYFVIVRWNGTEFEGVLVDRTPLLTGGLPVSTPIPFSVHGAVVEAFVASSGYPAGFDWRSVARSSPPSPRNPAADHAPGTGVVSWNPNF